MFSELRYLAKNWQKAWGANNFKNQFILTVLFFVGVCIHQFHFLRLWESRPGIPVNDFVLNLLPPADFSWPIFLFEYSALLLVFISVLPNPYRLVRGLQMFALIMFARTVTIYFFPLEPPKDMILLNDPMASFFLHSTDIFVTKDLFFSGHVSALALLMLIAPNKYLKLYIGVATIIVGVLILWQHVHYSMDVAFAPLVSYVAYKLVLYFHRENRYGLELEYQESA